jgi:hypothetical protein
VTTATPSSALQLRWDMKEGLLIVTPEDQDRFVIKVRRAIELLKLAGRADEFQKQFGLLLRLLAQWLRERKKRVEKAFLTYRDGALSFVVVRSEAQYDDDFEDAVSDLDFGIARDADLDLIKMDAIALPPTSDTALQSFLDPGFTLEYVGCGNGDGPHSAGQ